MAADAIGMELVNPPPTAGNVAVFNSKGQVVDGESSFTNPTFTSIDLDGNLLSVVADTLNWDLTEAGIFVMNLGKSSGVFQVTCDEFQCNTNQAEFRGALVVGLNDGTGTGGGVLSLDGGTISQDGGAPGGHQIKLPTANGTVGQSLKITGVSGNVMTTGWG